MATESAYKFWMRHIYETQSGLSKDSFFGALIALYRTADQHNKTLLNIAYPLLGMALKEVEDSDDNGHALFCEYGFICVEAERNAG